MSNNAAALLRREAAEKRRAVQAAGEQHPLPNRPPEVKTIMEAWLTEARELDAEADALDRENKAGDWEPQYQRPMLDAPDGAKMFAGGGQQPFVGDVPDGCYARPLSPEQKVADAVGAGNVPEEAWLGALGCLIKQSVGQWSPRESEKYAKGAGLSLKDMSTTSGGTVLVPTTISAQVIDLMRSALVTQAAGARIVPMRSKVVSVPRITGDVTAAFYNEGATVTFTDAALDSVTLTAKRLEAGTKVTLELEEDSDPVDIGRVVSNSIANAMALKVDGVALRGSGVAPEPQGIRFTSGVTLYAPGANGEAATWDAAIIPLVRAVLGANITPTALITTPGLAMTLAALREGGATGAYLAPPPLFENLGIRQGMTSAIPSNLTKGTGTGLSEAYVGDFRQLLIGTRVGLQLETLREVYRAEGKVGIVGRMRVDTAVEHPAAFAVATFVDE